MRLKKLILFLSITLTLVYTFPSDSNAQLYKDSHKIDLENIQPVDFFYITEQKDLDWKEIHNFYLAAYKNNLRRTNYKRMTVIARLFLFDTVYKIDFTSEHANYYLKEIACSSHPSLKIIVLLMESGKLDLNDPETLILIRNSVEKWRKHSESSNYSNQVYLEGTELLKDYLTLTPKQRDY